LHVATLGYSEVASTPASGGPAAELAVALGRAERAVTRRLAHVLAAEGCSVEAWRTLSLLARGVGYPMTQLAEAALLPAPSLTRLVERLVADNLVYRRADEQDRRRILVYATARGRALQRRLHGLLEQHPEAILAGMSLDDVERIITLLDHLD
jgi:DNA-binding MarR family transcriptional regulator